MKRLLVLIVFVMMLGLAGSVFAQDPGAQLRSAVFAGNAAEVQRLSASKATVNSANVDGLTPLMIAAALGQTDIAFTLLNAGADTEAKTTRLQATALMFAADFGRIEVATLLLARNANPKAVDREGYSAVDYSIVPNTGENDVDGDRIMAVGKFLSSKGTPMKMTADDSSTLLFLAEPDRLKDLIDRGRKF